MTHVVFYEKPGCSGNAKQRQWLLAAGHELDVRDLLSEPWTAERLRPFFGCMSVAEWFNRNAPAVRDGLIDPSAFDESGALAALIATPLLIRRPLMQVGDSLHCGFDADAVHHWIGLGPAFRAEISGNLERCAAAPGAGACPTP